MMTNASTAWSWRHAFARSSLPPTTKHVLHTLGMFMNELGEGCYPSVADICRYSGLDKKTVLKHLQAARDAGWIAVSQHGYRGQRWKRNEYAARWPERDLVASCFPADDMEGGGAVPPPSKTEKVVELVAEGGGTEGPKVVEEVHQDKTSPDTTPNTSPVERGARECGQASHTGPAEPDDRKAGRRKSREALERRFWKIARNHPQSAGVPKDTWLAEWLKLSAQEQDRAEARHSAWLDLLRAQGKDHVYALSKYFSQKLFDQVPDPKPKAGNTDARPEMARPFGKMWNALRLWRLLQPNGPLPKPTAFLQSFMDRNDEAGRRERLGHQARHGWPAVNQMHDFADRGRGVTITAEDDWLQPIAAEFEKVRVGSDLWLAWKQWHAEAGWPWLPDPGGHEWVYFPAGGPAGLEAFERAVGGEADDGA